jgi:hypothetical protein
MKHFFTYSSALLLGLALLTSPKAEAQQFSKRKQYNSVGVSLNAMNYFGDLVPNPDFTSFRFSATRPNVGLSITRRFYPRVSGRFALAYGRIVGDDQKAADQNDPNARFRYHRNMNFRNDIFEASGVVIVDLIENRNNYLKRPDFVPYVFVGIAGFHHSPQGQVKAGSQGGTPPTEAGSPAVGSYVDLQPLGTEGQVAAGGEGTYGLYQFSIPFGGGVRYRINRNFDASLEIGWRKTFTDYLDDVSKTYVDPSVLGSPAARYFGGGITRTDDGTYTDFNTPGAKRGTGDKTDWYVVTGISLNYILTPRIKNPKFR